MSLDFLTLPTMLADEDFQGFWPGAVSPNGRYVLTNKYRAIWTLDRTNETAATAFTPLSNETYSGSAIDNDGTLYLIANPSVLFGTGALVKIDTFGTGSTTTLAASIKADVPRSLGLYIMPDASKKLVWGENQDSNDIKVFTIGGAISTVSNSAGAAIIQTRQDSYGDVWAIGATTGSITFQRVVDGGAGTAAPDYQAIALNTAAMVGALEVYHTSAGWFVCWDGGNDLYLLDDTDFSMITHRSYASGVGSILNASLFDQPPFLLGLDPGADDFWFPGPNSFTDSNYSDLHKINAADLTSLDTHDISDWPIGDDPDVAQGMIYSTHTREALISGSLQDPPSDDTPVVADYTPVLRYFDEGGTGDDDLNIRVWSFSLDGHDFYVLRLGANETLVYDLTTDSWSHWASPHRDNWRAHIGQNWVGASATTMAHNYGTDVVAGDDTLGVLYILDPTAGRDDDASTGTATSFTRIVTGEIQISGRDVLPCGAVTLDLTVGNPTDSAARITLRTSDDHGQNYRTHGDLAVTALDYSAVIEWRGLGLAKAPGRIFEIRDTGASVRIGAANLR